MTGQIGTSKNLELEVREGNLRLLRAVLLGCLVLLLTAPLTGNGHTAAFHVLMAAGVGLPALVGVARVRAARDRQTLGTVGIQHGWVTLSLGVAFLSLVPSAFFGAPGWIKALQALLALVWSGLGVYELVLNARRLGVRASI